ncbi:hypothetical protein [Priestia megaterium]|uniref:hypothetical protein n=1 Tax=Priestia megaterium TaxID=1404 RepID=UPI000BFD3D84|nr:hypothetical protein [Priestia megaterium]PGO60587.1 hypothetical protein CN981_08545 [Priestia megaterium]
MSNTNDQRILELKKLIQEKKEKLGKIGGFSPITTCMIELDGVKYNLNAQTKEGLIGLLVKLSTYYATAKKLDLADQYVISHFKVEDWITDINSKLDILSKRDEEKSLKAMEKKLVDLLSEAKKTELEIDEIASLLGK